MAFSLSNWFKGKPESETADGPAQRGEIPPAAAPAQDQSTPEAQKARVTVRAVRAVTPHSAQPASLRAPSARQAIALPGSAPEGAGSPGRVVPVLPPSRKISFGGSADALSGPFDEPPRTEVSSSTPPAPSGPDLPVILEVGDFVDRLPSSFLQSATLDRQRKVEFRSSELYSDLTRGRASVPASVIYQKCADIFSRPVTATEDIEVVLPLQKLVEQMSGAFQTRQDQVAVESVGEIETPFLQVALEDNQRLPRASGTSAGPIPPPKRSGSVPPAEPPRREHHRTGPISTITPPKGNGDAVPTVAPLAGGGPPTLKRPPATVRASVAGAKMRIAEPSAGNRSGAPGAHQSAAGPGSSPVDESSPAAHPEPQVKLAGMASPSHQVAKKTARIQIPPISLRPAGSPPKSTFPAPPVAPPAANPQGLVNMRSAPAPDTLPAFRSNPGVENRTVATFRSTPPPAIKPPPPSFAARRTNLTPPPPSRAAAPPAAVPVPTAPLTASASAPADDRRISLKLAAVLRALPASALATDPADVSDEATISLPFAIIEPQLKSGRVAIPRAIFADALPAEFGEVIAKDAELAEVPLPLQEIFLNLPSSALSIRPDQVAEETGSGYMTPFSQKAEEDAKRFGVNAGAITAPEAPAEEPAMPAALPEMPAAPVTAKAEPLRVDLEPEPEPAPVAVEPEAAAEPVDAQVTAEPIAVADPAAGEKEPEDVAVELPRIALAPEPEKAAPAPVVAETPAPAPVAAAARPAEPPRRSARSSEAALQTLFMTDDEMDAKTIVKLVTQMPGINGCTVMFGDGLRLAGNFPENGSAEGFSAMSPPFYKRTMNFASELKLGELQAFTLYTDTGLLSFFMHDDICMSVRHAGRAFLPGVREKLQIVTRELAQMYSAAPPVS